MLASTTAITVLDANNAFVACICAAAVFVFLGSPNITRVFRCYGFPFVLDRTPEITTPLDPP